jgi:hypothetical protein
MSQHGGSAALRWCRCPSPPLRLFLSDFLCLVRGGWSDKKQWRMVEVDACCFPFSPSCPINTSRSERCLLRDNGQHLERVD